MPTSQIRILVFGGGRGIASIARALQGHPQVQLTVVVNAYDDGLSTGRVRAFLPGMLGPSDIRKNVTNLMPVDERCQRALRKILEHRLPDGASREAGRALLEWLAGGDARLDEPLRPLRDDLSLRQATALALHCRAFLIHEQEEHDRGRRFDFGDCSVGNLVFAGGYLTVGQDFNRAVEELCRLCECEDLVLNVTDGSNRVLCALKDDGRFLPDEATIVSPQDHIPIKEIFLLEHGLADAEEVLAPLSTSQRQEYLLRLDRPPPANHRFLEAAAAADIIVYGPGTQHSSLFPTYLTVGFAEAIAANAKAEKVFVTNILEDHDIQGLTAQQLLQTFHHYANIRGTRDVPVTHLVTRVFVQEGHDLEQSSATSAPGYVTHDLKALTTQGLSVQVLDWEAERGRHLGGRIADELLAIVRHLAAVKIHPYRHMVSIVVPVLDEMRSLAKVLKRLRGLDLSAAGVEKEIIIVDGGSTDGSAQLAGATPDVRFHAVPGCRGRGDALRYGFSKARGNVVVTFPADDEYDINDVLSVVSPILANQYSMVVGSRAIKCLDVVERIRHIHGDDWHTYVLSKYGGMLSSLLCLLLYNRYVSDPFSSLKAYDADLVHRMALVSKGVDLETEIIAKASRLQEFILEVPVHYRPRRKWEGKKTTVTEGLRALIALFRYALPGLKPTRRPGPAAWDAERGPDP